LGESCDFIIAFTYIPLRKVLKMTTSNSRALRRSRSNRVIAGVCGGLAEFFGISAFWFRLLFFIFFVPGGVPGILIYLIAMIVIPSE
jgi:phage shock protein PspC (stress-responsive transcriptional regulator)